jgi:hypothetical protein
MSRDPGFKLIRLSEVERPLREAPPFGVFSLIPFRSRIGVGMTAQIAPKELENWLSPVEALALAHRAFGTEASNAVWQGLCGGIIKAVAARASRASPPSAEPQLDSVPTEIPARYWSSHFTTEGNPNFWKSGFARFYFTANDRRSAHATVIRCYDVKLDPTDIGTMLRAAPVPAPPLTATPSSNPSPTEETTPTQPPETLKKPRVAEGHLKAWYQLFKDVYGGTPLDTEAFAQKSADGMFPDKFISRDRIRALRGVQKRGRKTSDSAK